MAYVIPCGTLEKIDPALGAQAQVVTEEDDTFRQMQMYNAPLQIPLPHPWDRGC